MLAHLLGLRAPGVTIRRRKSVGGDGPGRGSDIGRAFGWKIQYEGDVSGITKCMISNDSSQIRNQPTSKRR